MPLAPLSHGKLNLSHMMGCKYGCELAEKNTTVHIHRGEEELFVWSYDAVVGRAD